MYYYVIFDPGKKSRVRLCRKWQQNETGARRLNVTISGMDEWYACSNLSLRPPVLRDYLSYETAFFGPLSGLLRLVWLYLRNCKKGIEQPSLQIKMLMKGFGMCQQSERNPWQIENPIYFRRKAFLREPAARPQETINAHIIQVILLTAYLSKILSAFIYRTVSSELCLSYLGKMHLYLRHAKV